MKLENNAKLIDMVVKQQALKISHTSALVDKNVTIATVKRASRNTVERGASLKKGVRVAIQNAKSNDKLAEDRKKRSYDMARHVRYIKGDLEDSIDKSNCIQVQKRSVELRIGHLDRELLYIKVEMKVQIYLSLVSH